MVFQHFRIIWTIQIMIFQFLSLFLFLFLSFRDRDHQTKLIHEESSHKTSNKNILPAVISTYYLGPKTRIKYQELPSRRQ
jgi:hypothetical protein